MVETLLSLRGLSIEFVRGSDRRHVLDGIDIDVARDRVLGILGESGSGMTTLAKAMVGWVSEPLHVTGGELLYRGRDLRDLRVQREVRSKIGFIGADPGNAFDRRRQPDRGEAESGSSRHRRFRGAETRHRTARRGPHPLGEEPLFRISEPVFRRNAATRRHR